MLTGSVSDEIEVKVPASQAWEVYGSLQLAKIVKEQLPDVLEKAQAVEGDGGVGTILKVTLGPLYKLTLPEGIRGLSSYTEKFTVIDNEKMVKEAEVMEGVYIDLGFTLYRFRFEIIENGENSCIARSTIEYEVKEDAVNVVSVVSLSLQPLMMIMKAGRNYFIG